MTEKIQWEWKAIADDLVLDVEPTSSPDGRSGTWVRLHQRFSKSSFLRLLMEDADQSPTLYLEIALGPPPRDLAALERHFVTYLKTTGGLSWEVESSDTPWCLSATVPSGEDGHHEFRRTISGLLKLTDRFDDVDSPDTWFEILDTGSQRPDEEPTDQSSSPGVFETIGSSTPAPTNDGRATVCAGAVTRTGDTLHLALGFPEVLHPDQLRSLTDGLQSYLHNRYDAGALVLEDPDDRPELRLAEPTRTRLDLSLTAGDTSGGIARLQDHIDVFIHRLKEFTSGGVDLFAYLGVGDVVLEPSPPRQPRRDRTEPRDTRDADEVVFGFGSSEPSQPRAEGTLTPRDYTDPRLRRDDAETPLVDIVLRHPGYSDRRIGQVLSILLEVEYTVALELAERAPCVIAWGLGQERARSFKNVIESAGGKVVLVEPGAFGER